MTRQITEDDLMQRQFERDCHEVCHRWEQRNGGASVETTRRFPRTLDEAFPRTAEAATCIYLDNSMRARLSRWWLRLFNQG